MFGIKKEEKEVTNLDLGFTFSGFCQVVKKTEQVGFTLIKVRTTNHTEIGSELTLNIPDPILDKIIMNFDYLQVKGHYEDRTTKALNVKPYMFVDEILGHWRKNEKVAI